MHFEQLVTHITHDLGVVADIADDVVVMYAGRIVEQSNVRDTFYRPQMPYTMGLLASVPRMDGQRDDRLRSIPGQPPSLIRIPQGCSFRSRCPYTEHVEGSRCATELPELRNDGTGHLVRCHIDRSKLSSLSSDSTQGAHA